MTTGETMRKRILIALRRGELTLPALADEISEPMFSVRAELQQLKRDRLVASSFEPAGLEWELTVKGSAIAWSLDQLEVDALEAAR